MLDEGSRIERLGLTSRPALVEPLPRIYNLAQPQSHHQTSQLRNFNRCHLHFFHLIFVHIHYCTRTMLLFFHHSFAHR